MVSSVKLSVVIPVYNSAETLQELYNRLSQSLRKVGEPYQIVFVDDASKDNSWEELVAIKKSDSEHTTIVQLDGNFGQHQAIVCGFNFSRGDLIVTMDDDLQHPPEELYKLVATQKQTNAAVVYGIYKTKKHGFMRSTSSLLVQKSAKYFSDHSGGVGSSFRLFKKEITDKMVQRSQNFMFIDEVIHWYTGSIETVPVEHHERIKGKTGYTPLKLMRMYFNLVVNYTAGPLKLMIYGGATMALVTFFTGIWFFCRQIFYDVKVEGFTTIIVAILFSTSLMLICFGIIGQYLLRIYQNQNGKPPYTIKSVL